MKKLKELRESRKLSQQKLAGELNLTQASISKYEKGSAEPDISTIRKLAGYFQVTTDYLLEMSDFKICVAENSLNDDEVEVVHTYRALEECQRQKVLAYLKGISGQ